MKMIYLASPYSHKLKKVQNQRVRATNCIAALLQEQYINEIAFICPITTSAALKKVNHLGLGGTFATWEKVDLEFIKRCDEVWVLPIEGWKESIGVQAEIKFADERGIPVIYLDGNNLLLKIQKKKEQLYAYYGDKYKCPK